MVKIRWIITDDIANISLEEFDKEWNGMISGYLELNINGVKEGFCPDCPNDFEEKGMEEIIHWLHGLYEGLKKVKKGEKYEMNLLTMNVYNLFMKYDNKLEIGFINKKTKEVKWKEKVELQEFENELYKSIKQFLKIIYDTNPELLKSKWIKEIAICTFEY